MRHEAGSEILNGQAAVHDRTQFEVKFSYDVSAGNISQGKDAERFRIEAFCFFPTNMGINALSWPKENFYRNLQAYFRFRTPDLSELALLDPLNRQSPLNVLSFHLKRLTMGEGSEANRVAENEARLFGCIVGRLLKQSRQEILAQIERIRLQPQDPLRWRELEGMLFDFLSSQTTLLAKYRSIVREYHTISMRLDRGLLSHLRQVDEFLTYRFDDVLSRLHFQLSNMWDAPEALARIDDRVRAVAEEEARYRAQAGYIRLSPTDESGLALYTYRSSALKKLVEQVLYLDVRTIQQNQRWRNLAAMAGALIAAVIAGFMDRRVVFPLYSANFFLAIALFGLFYVIKDRIKELGRELVWTKVSRYFPDNKLLMREPVSGLDVGRCTERLRYCGKKSIDADVLHVRNLNHAIDLDEEREETVIIYQNDVHLNARGILTEHRRRSDIKHILRFSVEDLLSRMDDPTVRVQFYDAELDTFCRVRAPKVYHLNVVFRFTRWDDQNRRTQPHYQRIRVVLDKNGIQRIEPVAVALTGTGKLPPLAVSRLEDLTSRPEDRSA